MNVYSHVVFDVDGTLLDTEYSIIRSLQRLVFQMHGTRISEEDLQFSLGITGADALKQLNIPDTEENFAVWNQFADEEEHTIKVFEKIEETLKKLKEKGVHLGVITSRSREEYEKGVSSRGLHWRQHLRYEMCKGGWGKGSAGAVGMQKQGAY